ncbi:hypothetical protein GCM10017714_10330 [Curtobacterium pusillum]|uniref:DNA-binding protein n=1 Tax=Curtobacterium pusillum TaxID=69373 RepID=A0AAW3T6E3_9MICO|nr:hypothetical protein [Curtobacterium pusillum]MBA8990158.1 hypothetical protein [Curtobacterium pusillum]NUU12909.1 hypothetical protein [Curtobacterium pusillum]GLK30293.1 hypothetical protein GCM10017610_05780 [Curtobacterium pusillum]
MATTARARARAEHDGANDRAALSASAEALLDALRRRLVSGHADGALGDGVDVDVLADRMVAALPAVKHEADALIGPFYDTPTLAAWRGVTRQALSKATAKRDLIGLKIGDGSLVYPSFQFGASGAPLPNLRQVLALIDPDRIDPWGSALWLNTVADEFGGTTAAQALRDGRDEQVLAAARRAAHAWAADA